MQNLITIFLFPFITIYMIIPYFITRIFGVGVFKKGSQDKQIAFTFDDGPDPRYTPELLDLLRDNDVKATFFVLGSKAEKHPDLIKRIHAEGHQIGIHNYTHTPNWVMTPWKVKRKQVDRSAEIVEQITGERPNYYRPPWGILNMGDFIFLRKAYRIILWSVMAWDWNRKVGSDRLRNILLKNIKPGSIILLHDSGDTPGADEDAPKYMLQGLAEVFEEIREKEYKCVRIDQLMDRAKTLKARRLKWHKRLFVRLWLAWDWCFCKLFGVHVIDANYPLFKLRLRKYSGKHAITFENGEQIAKGDSIIEMHFDNKILTQMSMESKSSVQLATKMIRQMQKSLPNVIHKIETDPKYRHVKGLYGVSMIHRGATQLGFTVYDLPQGAFARITKIYLNILLSTLHPEGNRRLKVRSEMLVPKTIAMTKQQLFDKYTHSG